MKIAYLILTHSQPGRTACLAKTLAFDSADVYVHIDAKAEVKNWESCKHLKGNVTLIKERVNCCWGHISLVKASLNLLSQAFHSRQDYDYFILLSGQDYPIKSADYISNFLHQHKGQDFIEYFSLPSEKLREKQGGLYRINRFHQIRKNYHKEFPPYSKKPVLNVLFNKWAEIYFTKKRPMPLGMQPYGGSQWWMLTNKTVGILLHFLENNPSVEKFFENVWIPDEIFFQTVLMHLQKEHGLFLVNNNYRHTQWTDHVGENTFNPKILCEEDYQALIQSDALFARKFDENVSAKLIKMLQEHFAQ